MEYQIREIRQEEYGVLNEFLYEAIFIPEGVEAPPKSIVKKPELQVYVSDFGKKDDCCLVAEVDGKIIGAVWTRIMYDYGHIDDSTPSFAISLSVQKANAAYRLYLRVGFTVVDENEEEYIMVCDL